MDILQQVFGEQQCCRAHVRLWFDNAGLRRGGHTGQNVPTWALILLESDSYKCTPVPPCSLFYSSGQIAVSQVPEFTP